MAIFRESDTVGQDRTAEDRRRHRQLVEDSIKKNLSDILSEESIIGEHKDRKIKVPIRGIKEYRFIYGRNVPKVGSGNGSEKRGDIIENSEDVGGDSGIAGSQEGDDIYETEVTIEDIIDYLFEDLNLPRLDRKRLSQASSETARKRAGYQRKGIPPRLAKKRSVIEKIKRKQSMRRAIKEKGIQKEIGRFPFREDDLKYYRTKKIEKRTVSAVIICIMDTSGSMDQTKKYYGRSFFFLLYQFVRMKYYTVEVIFISHSTTAKVVNEVEFFHKVQSGGTYISSGYEKALEVIEKGYNPAAWNIYAFHASDGDNWSEDDSRAIEYANKLCYVCNLFGYVEIGGLAYPTNIKGKFIDNVRSDNFAIASIDKKEDIWPAFRSIINKEVNGG